MTDLRTSRLVLHPVDRAEAERIVSGRCSAEDHWAEDFPGPGDLRAVGAFLDRTSDGGDPRPFGFYRVTRAADGRAVGGIGFKEAPQNGTVEIGYGLSPSARGHGYAAEAIAALLSLAGRHGLHEVTATTDPGNIASRRSLERAGLTVRQTDGDLLSYAADLRADEV